MPVDRPRHGALRLRPSQIRSPLDGTPGRLNTIAVKCRIESPLTGNSKSYHVLRRTGLGFLLALTTFSAVAAQIIENPKKPPAPDAGRIVPLKEIARITDIPGKFAFVQPFAVFAGDDGSVYVQEFNQFLKFDAAGRFVGNLLKRGDGPGELSANLTDVIVRKNDILFYSSNNLRFIRLDLNGKLLEDRRFDGNTFWSLLGLYSGRYFFLKREPGQLTGFNGISESAHRMVIVPTQGDVIKTPEVLRITEGRSYWRGRPIIVGISRLTATWVGDHDVFLFHSPDYLIKHLDLETGRIVQSFRRPYDRVKYEVEHARGFPPELVPKYYNDLCALLWTGGKLWAVTSTFDPKKGILVDVFSREGKYLDNFYLPLLKIRRNNSQYYAPMAIHGNLLYALEAGEDDVISLVKYAIGEK